MIKKDIMKMDLALQGLSVDQTASDIAEWDRREQAAEQRDMAIEGRVNALWENKADICRVINENMDDLQAMWLGSDDGEKSIMDSIDEYFTAEAEADLNL